MVRRGGRYQGVGLFPKSLRPQEAGELLNNNTGTSYLVHHHLNLLLIFRVNVKISSSEKAGSQGIAFFLKGGQTAIAHICRHSINTL